MERNHSVRCSDLDHSQSLSSGHLRAQDPFGVFGWEVSPHHVFFAVNASRVDMARVVRLLDFRRRPGPKLTDISRPQNRISNSGYAMVFSNIGLLAGSALLGGLITVARKLKLWKSYNDIPARSSSQLSPAEQSCAVWWLSLCSSCLSCSLQKTRKDCAKIGEAEDTDDEHDIDNTLSILHNNKTFSRSDWTLVPKYTLLSIFPPLRILLFPPKCKNSRNRQNFLSSSHVPGGSQLSLAPHHRNCRHSKQTVHHLQVQVGRGDAPEQLDQQRSRKHVGVPGDLTSTHQKSVPAVGPHHPASGPRPERHCFSVACSLTNFTEVFGRAFAPNTSTFLALCVLDSSRCFRCLRWLRP